MRVIAGIYRSRVLKAPSGMNTRPTMDKVKESMFNIIGMKVYDAVVLDLFAGSGGLGIEALSRGAKKAYFNDHNYNSYKVIKENIENLKIDNAIVTKLSYLECLKQLDEKFDLILLDPPYKNHIYEEVIESMESNNLLNSKAMFVMETEKFVDLIKRDGYVSKEYLYGNKKLIILIKQA